MKSKLSMPLKDHKMFTLNATFSLVDELSLSYSYFDYCTFANENIDSIDSLGERVGLLLRIFMENAIDINNVNEEKIKKDILSNKKLGEPFIDFIYNPNLKKLENTINKVHKLEKESIKNAKNNKPRTSHIVPEYLQAIFDWRKKIDDNRKW